MHQTHKLLLIFTYQIKIKKLNRNRIGLHAILLFYRKKKRNINEIKKIEIQIIMYPSKQNKETKRKKRGLAELQKE